MDMNIRKGIDCVGITIVYFCHDGEGNVVLGKRSKNARDEQGRWDIGGGALEHGDTVENTLRKEIHEEYCTDVLGYEYLGYRDVHRTVQGTRTHWIALDFKVLVDREKVRVGEPHKFDAVEWFKLDSLPDEIHSQLPVFLEKYKERLEDRAVDGA
jgi:8-oxo-dGTP diphosphatase